VGYRCGAGHESRQREGMVVHAAARRGTGAGGGGSGSGGAMPMCRAGKDQHAGGVRLGKEIGVWAAFRGCGPVALGQLK
jgi:hypothetical protein